MSNIHEEEQLEKSYDSRLMRRLLSYVKPYWKWMALSITLLLLITVADLARPYLIKVAIDDHMGVFNKTYVAASDSEVLGEAHYAYQNKELVREDKFPETPAADRTRYTIEHDDDSYLMVISNPGTDPTRVPMTEAEVDVFKDNETNALLQIGSIYLVLILGSFVLNYIQTVVLQWTGQRIIFNIRQQLFSHLQRLAISFFDKNPVGRLVTRVMNDTEALNEMYSNMLVTLFKDVFILIGIVIVMFQLNTQLAWISLVCIPFVFITSQIYRKYARAAFRDTRVKLARINATLAENISGMKVIQYFRREKQMHSEFDEINQEYFRASWRELMTFAVFRPTIEFWSTLALAIVVWYGGGQVLNHGLELGVLYAFISYIQQFFQPINDLSEKYNILQSAMASSERIFQLMDTDDDIKNPERPVLIPNPVQGRVEFKNVWFAYVGENWVLRDVSFTIEPGETIAFVGATGAGKSSILSLIARFYDIQKGEILVDGVNIKHVNKDDLRRAIGIVQQDVFLFTGTIRENIRLAEPLITDDTIEEAIHHVNADIFINKLPGKLDEPVLERGSTFSAGQRQLISFARALAFDPAILVLDEATSNIDTETESLIQDALDKLTQNRTTIVVAHRLSTIQNADKIIVMHKGRIREIGNHQSLLAQEGMYYNLYQLQYKEHFHNEAAATVAPSEA